MKNSQIKPGKVAYEYEIGYSQSTILFDLIFGLFLIVGGTALAVWIRSWIGAMWPLLGIVSIWRAIRHFRQQGPQLKISKQGIWTDKAGFIPWARATASVKTEVSYRSVTTRLVLVSRINKLELVSFRVDDLAIDARELQAYIEKFSPK